ncbi:hypothetical protein B0H13DRAFT_2513128, partial [Mycena leptocephala]
MNTSRRDLAPLAYDSDSETSYSTPDPLDPSLFILEGAPQYTSLRSLSPSILSGFAADTSPIPQLERSAPNNVATWSPNTHPPPAFAIDSTLSPVYYSNPFSAPWPENASPGRVDRFANADGAVSAAFLQLVESHGHGRSDNGLPLLRLLLRDGYLPRDELLAVVDWDRLRNLAAASVSRAIHFTTAPVTSTITSRHSELYHSPSLLTSNATMTHSDLHGVDHFDHSRPADMMLDHPISDYQLHDMLSIGSAVQLLSSSRRSNDAASPVSASGASRIVSVSSPTAPAFLTLPPETPFHLPEPSIGPELGHPLEHQQPASQTHTSTIVDAASAPKRRCLHCAVDHTTQWRTHPKSRGYLCNACGQHMRRHKEPRSLQAIMRERARANDGRSSARSSADEPSNLPQKRGGEMTMRVPLK